VYYPETRQILERGSVHKLEVDESQLLQYYQRRKIMREPPLSGKEIVQVVERLVFNFNSKPSAGGTPAAGNKLAARARAFSAKITSKRALKEDDRERWLEAIKVETDQLCSGTLVEDVPQGARGVDYKVMKIELKDDGRI
jgi:hypothetical protein